MICDAVYAAVGPNLVDSTNLVLLVTVDMQNIWYIYSTIFRFISYNFGSKVHNISKLSDCLFIMTIYQKVRQLINGRWTHTLPQSQWIREYIQRSYQAINKILRLIIMRGDGSTYLYSFEFDSQMCSPSTHSRLNSNKCQR